MTTETIKDVRAHFGLTSIPFTREIVVGHRWSTPLFGEPLTALLGTVEARMSAALIAPSGTGKTLLLRTLRSLLPEARYRVHYIKLTSLSKRDLCREIALACRFDISGNYPIMMRKLQDAFRSQADDEGLRPVVLMDDSHDLRPEVVPLLRVLTNFDMDSRLVVSFILAGNTHSELCSSVPTSNVSADAWPMSPPSGYSAVPRLLSISSTASISPAPLSPPSIPRQSMPSTKSPAAISAPLTTLPASPSSSPPTRACPPSMPRSWLRLAKTCCSNGGTHGTRFRPDSHAFPAPHA
jgi:AAA domain